MDQSIYMFHARAVEMGGGGRGGDFSPPNFDLRTQTLWTDNCLLRSLSPATSAHRRLPVCLLDTRGYHCEIEQPTFLEISQANYDTVVLGQCMNKSKSNHAEIFPCILQIY